MNQIMNYLFLSLLVIVVILTIINLANDEYKKINIIFLTILNKMRFITNFFISEYNIRLSYNYLNDYIKEGNRYVKESKSLYMSIKLGLIFLVMLVWFLLLGNITNDILIPIMIILVFLFLFMLPTTISLLSIAKRIDKIENQNENKIRFKLESLILLIEIFLLIILNILLISEISFNDILTLDFVIIIIILLLYKPIKIICIKKRSRKV